MNGQGRRLLTLLLLGTGAAVYGGTVTFNADVNAPGDPVYSLTSFTADGSGMAGNITVTVTLTNGTVESNVAWVSLGGGCGHATGAAGSGTWNLSECGDTGALAPANPWTLTNTSTTVGIASVVLNTVGVTGAVFDRNAVSCNGTCVSAGGQEGTPGSALGITYTQDGALPETGTNAPFTVAVTYSSIVTLTSVPAATPCNGAAFAGKTTGTGCGDEWGTLTFAFTNGTTPGFIATSVSTPAQWSFFQDTDLVGLPEPKSFALVGLGLIGLAFFSRKRRARSV